MREKAYQAGRCASAQPPPGRLVTLTLQFMAFGPTEGKSAMSRLTRSRFHSAQVRAEMRALDLATRRLPLGTVLVSIVALANAASVISTLVRL